MTPTLHCPHAATCAGCPSIALPREQRLAQKAARLAASWSAYSELSKARPAPLVEAESEVGYRTRAKLMVGPDGQLGLYAREGDHVVVDIPSCLVLSPVIARVTEAIRAALRDMRQAGAVWLRAVDVREVEGPPKGALVTLVTVQGKGPGASEVERLALRLFTAEVGVLGVAHSESLPGAPQVLGPRSRVLCGAGEAFDVTAGVRHLATHGSFVQAHRGQAARIAEQLCSLVHESARASGKAPSVLELYAGTGVLGLAMARAGASVVSVESFGPSSQLSRRSAEAARLSLEAREGDAERVVAALLGEGRRFDLVVVNPPRRGVSAPTRQAIARLGVPLVAYVSCEPSTLARDAAHLARLGLAPRSVTPFDMIPLTDEVESLAVLARAPLSAPTVLADLGSAVVVDKAPHEPTTPQGEHAVSLLERVRRLPGLASAVPVQRLDVGTSGACLFARDAASAPAWQAALDGATKTFTVGAKGISSPKGVIKRPLRDHAGSIEAVTRYKRVGVFNGHSLLTVVPVPGKQHQVRRHLAGIGHPVLGDDRYGHPPSNRHFEERHGLDRPFLHCARLALTHPETQATVTVESPLAADLPFGR